MTLKKLASLAAITVAVASGAAPAAMAETGPDTIGPAPTSSRIVVKCEHLFGKLSICQIKWSSGDTSEYLCDAVAKVCIKQ